MKKNILYVTVILIIRIGLLEAAEAPQENSSSSIIFNKRLQAFAGKCADKEIQTTHDSLFSEHFLSKHLIPAERFTSHRLCFIHGSVSGYACNLQKKLDLFYDEKIRNTNIETTLRNYCGEIVQKCEDIHFAFVDQKEKLIAAHQQKPGFQYNCHCDIDSKKSNGDDADFLFLLHTADKSYFAIEQELNAIEAHLQALES